MSLTDGREDGSGGVLPKGVLTVLPRVGRDGDGRSLRKPITVSFN
jgi:hypothetical protein